MTRPSARGLAQSRRRARLRARGERVAAGGLAGFGAAQLQHVAAGRLAAEVVIEGDDAMHLGARQVQRLRDHRHGLLRHVAECLLQGVQDWKKRALTAEMRLDDVERDIAIPLIARGHRDAIPKFRTSAMSFKVTAVLIKTGFSLRNSTFKSLQEAP